MKSVQGLVGPLKGPAWGCFVGIKLRLHKSEYLWCVCVCVCVCVFIHIHLHRGKHSRSRQRVGFNGNCSRMRLERIKELTLWIYWLPITFILGSEGRPSYYGCEDWRWENQLTVCPGPVKGWPEAVWVLLVATLMFIEHLMYSGHGTAAVEGLPLYSFSDLEGRYHPIINLILKRGRLKVKLNWAWPFLTLQISHIKIRWMCETRHLLFSYNCYSGDSGLEHIQHVVKLMPKGSLLCPQTQRICQQCRSPRVQSLGWEDPPWRRKRQPTPVFLPGESHGQRSLVGYSPWGHKESDTTDWLTHTFVSIFSNLIFICIQRALCEYKKTQAVSTACFNFWK